ncbi:hypothetical protein HPB48_022767 [Haemaphysalis longicornis]|uniref:Uncharacterized protein n=1 Tax=Haemaphysalis longicornis TaxID=44386 RepID=A0A9J6GDD1_HAELO|nr:hypothetical protein HPB48_022767 [Haemaphysalis longicornis]
MREPRRSSSLCSKCRYYCRAGTTSLMSHFGLCSCSWWVGYCVMGAFLFEYLEAANERKQAARDDALALQLADALWQLTAEAPLLDQANWTGEAVARLRRFEVTLVQAVRKEGYDGKEDAQLQWSFTGALSLLHHRHQPPFGELLGSPPPFHTSHIPTNTSVSFLPLHWRRCPQREANKRGVINAAS